ncbi:MAG: bifunctional diaminohydroxyphosphoribosylaminopyrimidine deaminase/5-amino-6-(5-phosphoribosylamino)uracil reductase RibD [Phycisphaerae bacterium]|nr:bifunctional diaminohydroxyphosphoribosylaminopyrimidine deaminase/5-amino-6-(5-phosphoribosylamino)uracil reductase RibD [Phycisphaerae bacterium]
MSRWTPTDREHMKRAIALARRGQGFVEPNPMVGCVIVKGRRIVGQGYHRRFGAPHAESNALRAAGKHAIGATVYVTLEPCCHTGKTPPCADALIRTKIKRVVVAMTDPNPLVAGEGLKQLRAAGIRVELGLLRREALALNAPFVTFHVKQRPYVILKWAQSIDGKIATRTGDSKWITSRQSRVAAHTLRGRVDAVIVGVNTVLADDPALTARLAKPRRVATRIILDTELRTPATAKLVRTAGQIPTIITCNPACARVEARRHRGHSKSPIPNPQSPIPNRQSPIASARSRRLRRLARAGCEVLEIASDKAGIDLVALLRELRARGMTNVLVEGGGKVLAAFLREGIADEACVFVAPRLIGGETAPGPLRDAGPASMDDLPRATVLGVTHLGPDLCYNMKLG